MLANCIQKSFFFFFVQNITGQKNVTECVFEILDNRSLPGAVFPLHVVGRNKAGFVGSVSDPPPGFGVIQQPKALIFFDVQLLVLLGHVVELGDDDHLFIHLSPEN